MKYITLSLLFALTIGCASADQRMASRQDYRRAQVEAISVQRKADSDAAAAQSAERVAMWKAMQAAVTANPDAAQAIGSNMAIVAAVSSVSSNGSTTTTGRIATLNPERDDPTALDYVKAITPSLMNGLVTVGAEAVRNDYLKDAARYRRDERIAETNMEGKIYDVLGNAFDAAGDSNETFIIGAGSDGLTDEVADEVADDTFDFDDGGVTDGDVTDVTDDTTDPDTTEPVDVPVDVDTPDPDIVVDDDGDTIDDAVDCPEVDFSPLPPECEVS